MGGNQLRSCSSKRFAQNGVWEHRLRDKNYLLQENPSHTTGAQTPAQQANHGNQPGSAQRQGGHGRSRESPNSNRKRYLSGKK